MGDAVTSKATVSPFVKAFFDGGVFTPKATRKTFKEVEKKCFAGSDPANLLYRNLQQVQTVQENPAYLRRKQKKGLGILNLVGEKKRILQGILKASSMYRKTMISAKMNQRKRMMIRFNNMPKTAKGAPVDRILQRGRLAGFQKDGKTLLDRRTAVGAAKASGKGSKGIRGAAMRFRFRKGLKDLKQKGVERIGQNPMPIMQLTGSDGGTITATFEQSLGKRIQELRKG